MVQDNMPLQSITSHGIIRVEYVKNVIGILQIMISVCKNM